MILKSDFVKVIFASAGASDIRYKGAGRKKKQGFVAHFPPGTKKKRTVQRNSLVVVGARWLRFAAKQA
jgi:hypothetical protein